MGDNSTYFMLQIKARHLGTTKLFADTAAVIDYPNNTTLSTVLWYNLASTCLTYNDEHIKEIKTSKGTDIIRLLCLPVSHVIRLTT